MFIGVIALGTTLLAIFADLLLRIGIQGVLGPSGDDDLTLLTLRSLESVLIILILLRLGNLELNSRKTVVDIGVGSSLVLVGWVSTHALDSLLSSLGYSPVFSQLKVGQSFTPTFFALAIFSGPLLEELFFRAALYQACSPKGKWEHFYVLIISTVFFAALHLNWDMDLGAQAVLFVMWSACGLVTMLLYMLRKSVIPGFIVHGGANGILFFL